MAEHSVICRTTTIEIADSVVARLEPTGRPNGQSILFVHGMWCGAWVWRNYLQFFSALGYACYALNLRGHHPSRPVPGIGKVSLSEYLTDVREVALALGDPILVGHSMGGLLVQKLTETAAPAAVVAITPAPPRGIFALRTARLLRAVATHGREMVLRRSLMLDQREAAWLALNGFSALEQARIYACFVPESGRAAFEMVCLGLKVNQARLRCPMLVVGARNDNMTPVQVVRKVAKKYRADYREYARSAHMIIMEPGWEDVSQDIASWLTGANDMAVRASGSNGLRLEMAVGDQ